MAAGNDVRRREHRSSALVWGQDRLVVAVHEHHRKREWTRGPSVLTRHKPRTLCLLLVQRGHC